MILKTRGRKRFKFKPRLPQRCSITSDEIRLLRMNDSLDNLTEVAHEVRQDNIHENEVDEFSTCNVRIARKLVRLQNADKVHSNDVANVINERIGSIESENSPVMLSVMSKQLSSTSTSWQAETLKDENDEFWQQVAKKTQQLEVTQTNAILEVYTDRIVKEAGNCDWALLWTLKQKEITSVSAELFVTILLQRGAKASFADKKWKTPLHFAAEKGWTTIAKMLLRHHSIPVASDKNHIIPLELAIKGNHNECATLLVKHMEPESVLNLFRGSERAGCRLSFHGLIEKPNMQTTVLAILDKMMQPLEGNPNCFTAYYDILDGDEDGCAPDCLSFNNSHKSCLFKIQKNNSKEIVYHDVVRLLLRRKWIEFVRFVFMCHFLIFIIHTAVMTTALVLAAQKADPNDYSEGIDIFRGMCEAVLSLFIIYNMFVEINELKNHTLQQYCKDYYNYVDNGAILFPALIIPFRIINSPIQWIFASLGYLCQTLRGIEFAAVLRSTGAYVQILFRIFVKDMIPFSAIFLLFLFSFSGAFYFALRGEELSTTIVIASNCSKEFDEDCVQNVTTRELSSLNIYPHLTKEYYHVLFTNLRIMIEAGGILDDYFGPSGFGWLSVIVYTIFLFLVLTILLNLLIAQMSDTYSNVQNDAQRSFYINRAWIVSKVEQDNLFASVFCDCRKKRYVEQEDVNPYDLLDKGRVSTLTTKQQGTTYEELRSTMMEALDKQKQLINELSSMHDNTYSYI